MSRMTDERLDWGNKHQQRFKTTGQRFWEKVEKTDDCWLWIAAKDGCGYGLFRDNGKTHRAHRFIYQSIHGDIPKGLHVCHACDTPSCVNPDHLWLGTNLDNIADKTAKGRTRAGISLGEANGQSKLTETSAAMIKTCLKAGYSQSAIADAFNVSRWLVQNISNGDVWGHVDETDK